MLRGDGQDGGRGDGRGGGREGPLVLASRQDARGDPVLVPLATDQDQGQRFARLDDLARRAVVDLQDRQLVETFMHRIEINPEAKSSLVYMMAELGSALLRSSPHVPAGDRIG